jgi:uncharacterized protein (DUF58 family)
VRPTREGAGFLLVTLGVMGAAVNTGNNLLYLVLACLLGTLLVSNLLAEWNLRGLTVHRKLPAELFARRPALGMVVVDNHRKMGTAWTLRIIQRSSTGEPLAEGRLLKVAPGDRAEVFLKWSFPRRGMTPVGRLRVESSFPFGLILRWQMLDVPASLLVYPFPLHGSLDGQASGRGQEIPDPHGRSRSGDLLGLRPYVPGDPIRDVHWPTSARSQVPMVLQRDGHQDAQVVVSVDPSQEREHAISQATGAVLSHLEKGHAVGLQLDGAVYPARSGVAWRSFLLQRLAEAPGRHP